MEAGLIIIIIHSGLSAGRVGGMPVAARRIGGIGALVMMMAVGGSGLLMSG